MISSRHTHTHQHKIENSLAKHLAPILELVRFGLDFRFSIRMSPFGSEFMINGELSHKIDRLPLFFNNNPKAAQHSFERKSLQTETKMLQ